MTLRLRATALVTALVAGGVLPAHAQTSKDFDELRQEVKRLREEIEAMKKAKTPEAKTAEAPPAAAGAGTAAATATALGDRVEALEIKSKDAVVKGDIDGSFRLPGSETSVRIYGYAEAHAIHDFGKTAPDDNFTNLMFQPLPSDGEQQRGKTKFTAQTSRFGFETATPTQFGTFNTKVEADFYSYGAGNRERLRLRHAYGEYAGFLVGKTWSTFMDVDDLPETVDFNGPIGSPFSRRAQVRYTWGDVKAGYKFAFALEDPEDQFGGGSANERMPQLVARFDKSFDWGAVNVRGLVHEKRSFAEAKRGYGLGIGGSYKLTDKDTLMAQFAVVEGDIDQMYGSNGYAIDPTTGAISFDRNKGLILGYAKVFNEKLRGNVALGLNWASKAAAVNNKRLTQLHIGAIYSPIKNVELGTELILGQRRTFEDTATGNPSEKGNMTRLDLMGRYSF
jgi:outer membrane murein-binding lipoprotein Lpp